MSHANKGPPRRPTSAEEAHLRATSERLLPSLGARPRVVMPKPEIDALDLSDGARSVIALIDGAKTVHELAEATTGVENIFDALDELEHEGVISLARR